MLYTSTRGAKGLVPSACAIKTGLAGDGGLYVPLAFQPLNETELRGLCRQGYVERALTVMGRLLTDYSTDELREYFSHAYTHDKFGGEPAPLHLINGALGVLELWHGPTSAFKDMALQVLPYLLTAAAKKTGEQRKIVILVATSGDTGKAALEGFKDVPGTEIVVFYPSEGVSEIQKLQMMTTAGKNVKVFGLKGNFDDAQRGVKEIFADKDFRAELDKAGFVLSSANSINWGRLAPQIVYYFSAYADAVNKRAVRFGDEINFVVPTGNFGDILAGYYAKLMGLPVHRLICASNSNNVLTDFLDKGVYDKRREFFKTMSPSMDILVSSNLERLLYIATQNDAVEVAGYMQQLQKEGIYHIHSAVHGEIRKDFYGAWASEEQTKDALQLMFMVNNYISDPHTAVAISALKQYQADYPRDGRFTIVLSTASPYKFAKDVLCSLGKKTEGVSAWELLQQLQQITGTEVPAGLAGLQNLPVLHDEVIEYADMREKIKKFLEREQ